MLRSLSGSHLGMQTSPLDFDTDSHAGIALPCVMVQASLFIARWASGRAQKCTAQSPSGGACSTLSYRRSM